jgi:hypothetical protein
MRSVRTVALAAGLGLCPLVLAEPAPPASSPAEAAFTSPEEDARTLVLFDGTDTSAWLARDGDTCPWKIEDGAMVAKKSDVATREKFEDCKLHLEFWLPATPTIDAEQAKSNSGVYFQRKYEIQVLDSWQRPITKGSCGAVYGQKGADVNASKPPEQWQTYDIIYRAPRWDGDKKVENARITVIHNGQKIQDNVEIPHPTRAGDTEEKPGPESIVLQYHGHPVKYRKIWIIPLTDARP